MKQVVYSKQKTTETPAGGVTGVLCRSLDSKYFFRIYHENKTFSDYDLRRNNMTITITADELASFYQLENDQRVLGHSSDLLGLTKNES